MYTYKVYTHIRHMHACVHTHSIFIFIILSTALILVKMEAAKSPKMLVSYCDIKQHHNPEDDLNLHWCENLKSCIISSLCNKGELLEQWRQSITVPAF